MLRILADENFPGQAVQALRNHGFDVVWVRTAAPGISDQEVLTLASVETRLLITFDKDFGELAFRSKLPALPGIILFRIPTTSPLRIAQVAIQVLDSRSDWAGHFSVIDESRLRMTPLPRS